MCVHVCTCKRLYVHVRGCMYMCVHVRGYTCTCKRCTCKSYICVHTCVCIYHTLYCLQAFGFSLNIYRQAGNTKIGIRTSLCAYAPMVIYIYP